MSNFRCVVAAIAALSWSGIVAQEKPQKQNEMPALLALAKLAEVRGDHATAERDLRAAVAKGGDEAKLALAQLARLLTVQGRADEVKALIGAPAEAPAAQDPQGQKQDPVQHLIDLLDTGDGERTGPANDAQAHLSQLGALIVPQLVGALPRLGPFGHRNVLTLLGNHDDPRITAGLGKLLTDRDASRYAIAERLERLQPGVAVPLAQQIAAADFEPRLALGAMTALVRLKPTSPDIENLAKKLAVLPEFHEALGYRLRSVRTKWVIGLLADLMSNGREDARWRAAVSWAEAQPGIEQDAVVAALQSMDPWSAYWACESLRNSNREWVRLGILQASIVRDGHVTTTPKDFVSKWEWWRDSDDAAPVLLALRARAKSDDDMAALGVCVQSLYTNGWRVPAGKEAELFELAIARSGNASPDLATFVRALPDDAEPRVLALLEQLDTRKRSELLWRIREVKKPWHHVAIKALASWGGDGPAAASFLDRDWRGAPPEVFAALTELVKSWPKTEVNIQPNQPTATTGPDWREALVRAFRRTPDMPVAVIMPLLEAGSIYALDAFEDRDLQAALAYVRTTTDLPVSLHGGALGMLIKAGGPEDIALATRLAGNRRRDLHEFLRQRARGAAAAIRLACLPLIEEEQQGEAIAMVGGIAKEAKVAELAGLLAMLPSLENNVASTVCKALEPDLQPEHAGTIAAAIDQMPVVAVRKFTIPGRDVENFGTHNALICASRMAARVGATAAIPPMEKWLAKAELPDQVRQPLAYNVVKAAGGDAEPVRRLLRTEHAAVLRSIFHCELLRTDAQLRGELLAAVLRLGEQHPLGLDYWCDNLPPEAQLEFATAIARDARFDRFSGPVASAAMQVLGIRKDPTLIPLLQRGCAHTDAYVRTEAATALGNTFSREAGPHLLELLKDDNDMVRDAAKTALDRLADYLDTRAKWEQRLK